MQQFEKGKQIEDIQFEVLLNRNYNKYQAMLKLKALINDFSLFSAKILEFNRKFSDVIYSIYNSNSIYDSFDKTLPDETKYFQDFINSINTIQTQNFQVCENITDEMRTLIENTQNWENYYFDLIKLKDEKEAAFKNYEYYSSKIGKLRKSISDINIEEEIKERLEKNELKYVKSHSDYMSKSFKAYNLLERCNKNFYKLVNPSIIKIHNTQSYFFNKIASNFNQMANISDNLNTMERKVS